MLRRRENHAVIDVDAVHAALARVEDPEIHRPITELGMVGEVAPVRGGVRIEVRLTTAACPLKEELRRRVTEAVAAVAAGGRVEVALTTMSDPERMALARRLRGPERGARPYDQLDTRTRVYAVASGKGGVGKSTITANLAAALAQEGRTVGVLDADVWGYSMPALFDVHRSPVAIKGVMLPVEAYGVRLMSTGFFVDDEPIAWRGPMLHKALEQFLTDVHWGELDVLLLDLPPGTGDVTMSLLELCPRAQLLAVTTPQRGAQRVAARVGRMARDQRMPVAGVIENMTELHCGACDHSTPLFGQGGGTNLAEALETPLLGQVPLDLPLREAGDAGRPAVLGKERSPAAAELRRIAAALPATRPSLVGQSLPLTPV